MIDIKQGSELSQEDLDFLNNLKPFFKKKKQTFMNKFSQLETDEIKRTIKKFK